MGSPLIASVCIVEFGNERTHIERTGRHLHNLLKWHVVKCIRATFTLQAGVCSVIATRHIRFQQEPFTFYASFKSFFMIRLYKLISIVESHPSASGWRQEGDLIKKIKRRFTVPLTPTT